MTYEAKAERYNAMKYNRCGKSGILLPAISLGLWHNFGHVDDFETSRKIIRKAFDEGITHFDLANNYGPPPGSAEENFGRVLKLDLMPYRDEIIVSSKAGYYMWPGPYGEWGSKKNIIASCDQSLKRLGLEYVDIFYHHRPDPHTPLEESMGALAHLVKQGKALYAGISNYKPDQAKKASEILKSLGVPCLIHQPRYNMFDRWIEDGLLDVLEEQGIGAIAFSPLAQGMLTDRYLNGIPKGSRASKKHGFLKADHITPEKIERIKKLNALAANRGQSLAQMALAWILRDTRVTSVLIGASSENQLLNNLETIKKLDFTKEELEQIELILKV